MDGAIVRFRSGRLRVVGSQRLARSDSTGSLFAMPFQKVSAMPKDARPFHKAALDSGFGRDLSPYRTRTCCLWQHKLSYDS